MGREFEGKCLTGADYLSAPVFEKYQTPPIPPYVTCVTVLTLKQISGREGNAILINESNKNKLTKKKQRRFACNYIALVSDFI